ncbi:MAG: hypothetical protein ABIH00_00115 [Armatimonadota bacterium]
MKKLIIVLIAIAFMSAAAFAGSTDTQTVYFEIDAINEVAFGADITLTIDTATAGSEPDSDGNISLTYAITTNETAGKKLTGALNANMPSNTLIRATLVAPSTGATAGEVTLNSTAQSLVTSIETVAQSGISYTVALAATVAAGLPADGSRVLTFTLTDE